MYLKLLLCEETFTAPYQKPDFKSVDFRGINREEDLKILISIAFEKCENQIGESLKGDSAECLSLPESS